MGSMLDLPAALRAAGLTVWVAPDWKTNGHTYDLIRPYGGVLHHTAGYGLRSVYGLPDARPDVPQPRCNLWTPRPGTQSFDIAVICAGRAWQAGTNNSHAHDRMKAGGFGVKTPDAAVLYGSDSDDLDGGYTSLHTLGNEVEWNTGDPWTDRHLDVVATAMRVCVDVLGWPGVGSWAHHRQLTYRKPDMDYRGDIWTRAAQIMEVDPMADYAAQLDRIEAKVNTMGADVQRRVDWLLNSKLPSISSRVDDAKGLVASLGGVVGDDEAKILAELDAVRDEVLAAMKADPTQPASASSGSAKAGSAGEG